MVTCSRAMTSRTAQRPWPLRGSLFVLLVPPAGISRERGQRAPDQLTPFTLAGVPPRPHRSSLQREITILALLVRLTLRGTSGKGATGVKTLVTCTTTVLPGLLSGFHVTATSTGTPTVLLWTKVVMSAADARRPLEAPRTTA